MHEGRSLRAGAWGRWGGTQGGVNTQLLSLGATSPASPWLPSERQGLCCPGSLRSSPRGLQSPHQSGQHAQSPS